MAFSRYIKRPRLIFKYDSDTVAYALIVAMIPIIIGLFATKLVLGILLGGLCGYLVMKYYPKFAKEKAPGLVDHLMYDIGLKDANPKEVKKIPPGYINEFIE